MKNTGKQKKSFTINAWIVLIYALVVLSGGLAGYMITLSKPSLYASSISFILLAIFSGAIFKGKAWGYKGTLILILLLDAFFTFRFVKTLSFFPAGFMAILSLLVLGLLISRIRKAA